MKKRIISILLVLCVMFTLIPFGAMADTVVPTEQEAYSAMIALKPDYPEGMHWTNDNYYGWNGGIYSGGYGCAGFAFLLSDAAFDTLPARIVTDITIADVHVGDILRVNGNSHSVIVMEVYQDYVVLAEGNFNSSIHWGRRMSSSEVARADYMMTRYPIGTFGDAYTITYDANGGSNAPDPVLVDNMGTEITYASPLRRGYQLLGWALSATAAVPDYTAGDKIKVAADTILYAVWEESLTYIGAPFPAEYTACVPIGGEAYYAITPDETRSYAFESVGQLDTYITLYDDSWNVIDYNDDGGSNTNFRLACELTAGMTYYISVRLWDPYIPGNITFSVTLGEAHTHSFTEYVFEPTCEEGGYMMYTCYCGVSYIYELEPLGHEFCDGVCIRCGADDPNYISDPTHEHSYVYVVIEPTCTEPGRTFRICECGDSAAIGYDSPLGHDYKDGKCVRCGEEDPNYKPPIANENPFVDVADSAVYFDAVLWAADNGITSGFTPTEFRPGNPCTRGQVVTFLWRAAGCPEPTSSNNPFVDVQNSGSCAPYYKAILWAAEKGITTGVDAAHFKPNDTVTRAQFVTFLWRYEGKPATTGSIYGFADAGRIAGPFQSAVAWAVENGITTGYTDGTFRPTDTCTRWAVVLFMYRDLK